MNTNTQIPGKVPVLCAGFITSTLACAAPMDAHLVDIAPEVDVAEKTVAYHTSVADYNRDGFPDFLFNRRYEWPFRLYQNVGGTFVEDLRTNFGVRDRLDCEWGDPNVDGRPDFYCSIGAHFGTATKANELWIQQPDGEFREMAAAWNVTDPKGRGRQVVWLNFNGDRFPDLFVGNDYPRQDGILSPNRLFVNQTGSAFREKFIPGMTAEIGGRCAVSGDVDLDGFDDLLVCGKHRLFIYRNTGGGTGFQDEAPGLGLASYVDYAFFADLTGAAGADGLSELVLVSWKGVKIYPNLGTWRFGAPLVFPWPQLVWATAADIDGDMDLDIYASTSNGEGKPNPPDIVLRNRGDGGFDIETVNTSTNEGIGGRCVAIDHDVDGASGILVVNNFRSLPTPGPLQLMIQRPLLANGGFENDLFGWKGVGLGAITTSTTHGGDKAAVFTGNTPFTNFFYQTVKGLAARAYQASIWYKAVGNIDYAQLAVAVYSAATGDRQYYTQVSLKGGDSWNQAILHDIPVNAGEVVTFSIWMRVGAGGSLYLDDARVW